MGNHRIPTDRKEATTVGGCPNGCQMFGKE